MNSAISLTSKHPLSTEICQQIYFEAMRNARHEKLGKTYPDAASWERAMKLAKIIGPDSFIVHPVEIETIFKGVDIALYRFVEDLFCSRVDRSISMVIKIVNKRQESMKLPAINELAIWAICMYLLPKHDEMLDVTKRYGSNWMIEAVDWQIQIIDHNNKLYQPFAVSVLDMDQRHVISLEICRSEEIAGTASLALYKAIVSQRIPSRDGVAGLIWQLPQKVLSNIELDPKVRLLLKTMDINFEENKERSSALDEIQGSWERDITNRKLPEMRFSLILDNFLYRRFGYSPLLWERDAMQNYAALVGYNRDPLWQFPQLRILLERKSAQVNEDGTIRLGANLYTDVLLDYWSNQDVDTLISPSEQSFAWVYDSSGDVICQALAI